MFYFGLSVSCTCVCVYVYVSACVCVWRPIRPLLVQDLFCNRRTRSSPNFYCITLVLLLLVHSVTIWNVSKDLKNHPILFREIEGCPYMDMDIELHTWTHTYVYIHGYISMYIYMHIFVVRSGMSVKMCDFSLSVSCTTWPTTVWWSLWSLGGSDGSVTLGPEGWSLRLWATVLWQEGQMSTTRIRWGWEE